MSGLNPVAAAESQAELIIDLAALVANWRSLAARIAPAMCAAVVKADAYGVGAEQASKALFDAGCRVFFVAQPSEGVKVRAVVGPEPAIYVLNGLIEGAGRLDPYGVHDLRPVLGSLEDLRIWSGSGLGGRIKAALHVDSGMNRLGLPYSEALALALAGQAGAPGIDLVMSHFVSSEEPNDPLNALQIGRFEAVRAAFPGLRASMANSAGLFLPQRPFYDLARPGYALYGGNPTPDAPNPMRAVVTLRAPIIQTREIGVGESVGYNAQWSARRSSRLATIGVGYADGLLRALMGTDARMGGEAMVAGVRCPFAGRVSMDLTVIDVTDVPGGVRPGDMVELLGADITVDDMAARAGTIGYEILTNLGRRYVRSYRN